MYANWCLIGLPAAAATPAAATAAAAALPPSDLFLPWTSLLCP